MSGLSRMYRGEIDVDFPKLWKVMLTVSGVLVLVSLVAMISSGVNLAIDFKGGAIWDVSSTTMTSNDAGDVLALFGKKDGAKIQIATDQQGHRVVHVQAEKTKTVAESQRIAKAFATVWRIPADKVSVDDAKALVAKAAGAKSAQVTSATEAGTKVTKIQSEPDTSWKDSQKIAAALADKVSGKTLTDANQRRQALEPYAIIDGIDTNTVGPSWGSEISKDALRALIVFLIVIAAYISWQLEWRMAVSALVGVIHDIIITVGVYAVFRFSVTPTTVISFLTILGYSLYDTIVVYDRVHENTLRYDRTGQYTYTAIMRRSLNQTLMRSTNTTIVALLPVVSILVVGGILGGQTVMLDFALALLVGLISGAYSSVFVAAPVVVWMKEREDRYQRVRKRARDRGVEAAADRIRIDSAVPAIAGAPLSAATAPSGEVVAADSSQTLAAKAAMYQRPHPPRPRKTKK